MAERVVITGMGLVSPMGHDVETVWQGLLTGKNGMNETTLFDASTFPTKFGAEVKDFDLAKVLKKPELHKDALRGSAFVLGACAEACKQAGIETETDAASDGVDRENMGIYLGAGEGAIDSGPFFKAIADAWNDEGREMDWEKWAQTAFGGMTAMRELEQEPNMPAGHLAVLTGARGPVRSCLTACAASTQAVGEAAVMVRSGQADIMIAGGAHSMIHPLGVSGFSRLTALSTRNDSPETASRPFSASRDGFVLGEGGAIVILESLSSAKKRGAKILAEITGFGSSADAFRVTDMHDEARGAVQALKAAMADAGVGPEDIDYICTHGTSTSENDAVETKAVKKAFGEQAYNVPLSSPKSMMGHLIGATGCAELIVCVQAMRDQTIPPTANLNDPDPELDLDYVPNEPRKAKLETVINESFGFGGQNNVIVLKKFAE
ncbi:3-oxoacyl-[acyl-carrier-protein] synthase 2 [Anaerohalosphaera lusitana]|uniref:3-oxoacyl-[acyl-carrier-protein] synthase 2 n=1 Tax=Anaerohalosphaera lusitana TaxID=1936003 RepID=A0A1U9NM70_9BACT|nr:beta-ketoacyl-ACP synthase II [Anaerohalosphaera lusitana]AQT68834.1 3-oxoacyl-[acyl-carrier-protein] synthase 2 [Anaerohalosphaera lusitana]